MNAPSHISEKLEPCHLDEIRASVHWQNLFIGLGLRKADKKSKEHDWWAFSPFRDEKTPSFHMGSGGLWYDFSIGEGGGSIELVQKLNNLNCYEAGRFILDQGWTDADIQPSQAASLGGSESAASSQRTVTGRNRRRTSNDRPSQKSAPSNPVIRQDLIPLTSHHEILDDRGISVETCELLGIGYLAQGRSMLRERIIFQIADARSNSDGEEERVILSHIGRAVKEEQEPKYLFYEGFHKSVELYGQEIIKLHEDAREQAKELGYLLVTEGPFDVAKAFEAGLRNVVGTLGSSLSEHQADKLKSMADDLAIDQILLAYDRDDAGRLGAEKAVELLESKGLKVRSFDWEAPLGRTKEGPVSIPTQINDLSDLSVEQIQWLRGRKLL